MLDDLIDRARVFEKVVEASSYLLRTSTHAEDCRKYIDSRIPRNLQFKYGLGYFPTSDNLDYLIKMVGREDLERHNVLYNRYVSSGTLLHGHFSDHNLIMPVRNAYGDIVSLMGRSILPDSQQKDKRIQKYKYSLNADKELYVFGLDLAKEAILEKGYVICVEGQFDCIACHKNGIHNVVALGWATLSRYQFFQLLKCTNNIVLMLDNDEAGSKGEARAKTRYASFADIKTLAQPGNLKDIDEFFRKEPSEERKAEVIRVMKNLN